MSTIYTPLAAPTQPPTRATQWRGWALALAYAGWAAVLIFAVGVYWEMAPTNYISTGAEWSVEQSYWGAAQWLTYRQWVYVAMALEYLVGSVFAGTALLIVWRKPRDWVAIVVSTALLLFAVIFGIHGNLDTLRLPALLRPVYAWARPLLPVLLMAALLFFFYLFPNGRFAPRWSGWVFGAALVAPLAGALLERAWAPGSEAGWTAFALAFLFALLVGIAAQIYRFARVATSAERQQTKWVVYGMVVAFGLILLSLALSASLDGSGRGSWAATLLFIVRPLALLALPFALAVSLLRYGLWDVDVVINRTLVYGALTATLLLVYGLVVGAAARLLGLQPNSMLALIATGTVAVIFHPLQRRLQQAINRMMYGARDDPAVVLQRMGRQLESATAPEAALAALVRTIAQSLKLPYVALELAPDPALDSEPAPTQAGLAIPIAWGAPVGASERFPLVFQALVLGALVVSPRAAAARLGDADRRLLASLAQQAGPAVQAMLLNTQLQQSRRAVVAAREDERRRLRRDLHDGLGPQLASQTLTIDAIARHMDHNPAHAAALLQDLKRQTQDAVRDIRRVVHALRPPALDDLGLVEALREQAQRAALGGVQVALCAADDLPPLAAAVEVAAYRIVQEALANALRHADARTITINLALEADNLCVAVHDDGAGIAPHAAPGVGIGSMAARAGEVGGRFALTSTAAGTTARALLPLH